MIRKVLKKQKPSEKIVAIIEKYRIRREYLSINRRSVSNAVLLGMFIAMIPMPFQMVAVLFLVPFFKFNVPIALVLVWITNPLTIPFIYYFEYLTGNILLMRESAMAIEISAEWFTANFWAIFVPLYTGALFYSVLLGVGGYYLIHLLWRQSVAREKHTKLHKRKKASHTLPN
ncbi:MAG: flagellar biosynthesis protein FlhF [Sulfuricurvum sp. PC08-66]|nr:MAG: flagellar biosynthesis protein FlhF [Sulfuricurvum sp. PC08-66]